MMFSKITVIEATKHMHTECGHTPPQAGLAKTAATTTKKEKQQKKSGSDTSTFKEYAV